MLCPGSILQSVYSYVVHSCRRYCSCQKASRGRGLTACSAAALLVSLHRQEVSAGRKAASRAPPEVPGRCCARIMPLHAGAPASAFAHAGERMPAGIVAASDAGRDALSV